MKLKSLLKQEKQDFSPIADDKTKILFVAPDLNSQGYYRMIAPYIELPKYGYHTRMIGLKKWDFRKTYLLNDLKITKEAIQWADVIVFKPIIHDCTYFFQALRKINPNVKLIMDIFYPLHGLAKHHPEFHKIDHKAKHDFLNNLSQMDMVTSHDQKILKLYQYIVKNEFENLEIEFKQIPNLVSFSCIPSITPSTKQSTSIRIGILADPLTKGQNIKILKKVVKNLKDTYKEYISIIVIGWANTMSDQEPLCNDMEYQKNVSFIKYYQTIARLQLDMLLLPVYPNDRNSYASCIPYLDASLLKIPVIASKNSTYDTAIQHQKTGLLASSALEWLKMIQLLIESVSLRKEIANNAFQNLGDFHTFSYKKDCFY